MRFGFALLLAIFAVSACALAQNQTGIATERSVKWQFRAADFVDSSPIVVNDTVYIGAADGNLYAFEWDTGIEKWRFKTGGFVESTPTYYNGLIIVGSNDNSTYAINATTGAKAWQYSTGGKVYSSPSIAGGSVYFGSADGAVYALDAANGTYIWSFKTGDKVYSSAAIIGGIVYIGSQDGKLYALNITNGEKLWDFQAGGAVFSSPKIANNIVYFGSYDGKVYALDALNGSLKWVRATNDKITASPEVGRGIVWMGSTDGKMYAFNAFNGQQVWAFTAGDSIESTAYYSDRTNAIYFGSNDNNVYALDPVDGSLMWKVAARNWVVSTPFYYKGMLYFGSYDKNIYAVSTIVSYVSSPKINEMVNSSTLVVSGFSFADAGVKRVEVKLNTETEWHTATGTLNWSYTFGIANLRVGTYVVGVRATDNNNDVEPEPVRQVVFVKSVGTEPFQTPMLITFPLKARPGDWIRIEVRDDKGNPVPFVKVDIGGQTYYGDSEGIVDRDQTGNPITVTTEGGELFFTVTKTDYYVPANHTRLAITIYKEDYTLYMAAGALAVIAAVAYYVWKKRKTPTYL